MNKVLTLIGVLLVAAAGAYVIVGRNSQSVPAKTPEPEQTASPVASASAESAVMLDGVYQLDVASSSMQWQGQKTVLKTWIDKGVIALKGGSVAIRDGAVASGSLTVDMTTIAPSQTGKGTGQDALAKHLGSADFFDATTYPTAVFSLTSFVRQLNDYLVIGELTIKGISKPVSFPAELVVGDDSALTLTGSARLDRTQWDIKYGSGKFFSDLGDAVIDDYFSVSFSAVARLPRVEASPVASVSMAPVPAQ